jgi:hypothetical protein
MPAASDMYLNIRTCTIKALPVVTNSTPYVRELDGFVQKRREENKPRFFVNPLSLDRTTSFVFSGEIDNVNWRKKIREEGDDMLVLDLAISVP